MATQYRFVVDVNVGRLAKWLRVMGYDAIFPRESDDNDLGPYRLEGKPGSGNPGLGD